ncbi:hypothetical protein [Rhizobium leguminosarum]|uniref:hypothetical protein n=1 Tax=Rhizobium leguminosarum TaxID=384 RepID=UPI001441F02C|nr:hypothetical protein [Rhizobium leguminosarum]
MRDDLGGKAVALEMLRNGFGRIDMVDLPLPFNQHQLLRRGRPKLPNSEKNGDSAFGGSNPATPIRFF